MALNPRAPEFRPSSGSHHSHSPSPPPQVAVGVPQQPAFGYYPPPMMVYYYHHHHHHFVSSSSSPKLSLIPNHKYYYLPNPNPNPNPNPDAPVALLSPAGADEEEGGCSVGLISFPKPKPEPAKQLGVPKTKTSHRVRGPSHSRSGGSTKASRSTTTWVKDSTAQQAVVEVEDPSVEVIPISTYLFGASTSLMIRNIPVRLRRGELMELLDQHCRLQNDKLHLSSSTSCYEPPSEFDFLYLPIDFMRKGNKGYAFVNFTTWQAASRLYNSWEGTTWNNCHYTTNKICQISAAKFQGKALKERFQKTVFECESDEFLPVKINPPSDGSNAHLKRLITVGMRIYGRLT